LRRTHYDDDELHAWAARIAERALAQTSVYFMHEDEALGTRFAQRLNALWSAAGEAARITTMTAESPAVAPKA
jgi:uncharacterized protein YecE (DUF72 family)